MTAEKIAAAIARAKREITADVAAGTVPAAIETFADLHDYVDANEYGGLCEEGWLEYENGEWTEATLNATNAIQTALAIWIEAGGHLALCPECERSHGPNYRGRCNH